MTSRTLIASGETFPLGWHWTAKSLFTCSCLLHYVPLTTVSPQEDSKDGMTKVYKSLVLNVCKEMTSYSDFPFHEDYPNFMSHGKFWNYLQEFAEHFGLLKYIKFKVRCFRFLKVQKGRLPIRQSNRNEVFMWTPWFFLSINKRVNKVPSFLLLFMLYPNESLKCSVSWFLLKC